jgi:hypothetical protein
VKGLYKPNFWGVRNQSSRKNLYYVFAFVPDDKTNRFFVLTQPLVNNHIVKGIEEARKRALAKGKSGEKADLFPGVS